MKIKKRLDQRIQELHTGLSRTYIQSLIMQGKVSVEGSIATKPGMQVDNDMQIKLDESKPQYVSRAGTKLAKALDHFNISVNGLVAMDAGISTGGFTDCLLQNGIQKVYGIDVGYGQVHEKIAQDDRVVIMERTNLRYLEQLPELVDVVTLDLSFISVLKVMDTVRAVLKKCGALVVLIKPQFEAEKRDIGRGGIIKDDAARERIVADVVKGIKAAGFVFKDMVESPIKGTEGNTEFLAYFLRKKSG